MTSPRAPRRLIVNADDFGRSEAVNEAVIRAHREGILTSASLMVNEPAAREAAALARENPRLGVGLHLTLLLGRSALPLERIPGLVDARQEFCAGPVRAGLRFFFQRSLFEQLRAEVHAQFDRFRATGLPLDHVNGHLHLHLHPTIFRILMSDAAQLGLGRLRLTFDPFWLNLRLASGRLSYRLAHAVIFHLLALRARPVLRRRAFRHTRAVFGLLQNGRVNEAYLSRLLARLPPGDSELYSHPSLGESRDEFEALVSPSVRRLAGQFGIKLIRYQDL
jgi:hopanoid biosynthesis associated protein HpnK